MVLSSFINGYPKLLCMHSKFNRNILGKQILVFFFSPFPARDCCKTFDLSVSLRYQDFAIGPMELRPIGKTGHDFFMSTLKVNAELTYQLMLFYADELRESEQKMYNLVHMTVRAHTRGDHPARYTTPPETSALPGFRTPDGGKKP